MLPSAKLACERELRLGRCKMRLGLRYRDLIVLDVGLLEAGFCRLELALSSLEVDCELGLQLLGLLINGDVCKTGATSEH